MNTTAYHIAQADQLRAASVDAHTRLLRAAQRPHLRLTGDRRFPQWLTELFTRHASVLSSGKGRVCPHVGPSPRVVCAFAWAPGVLLCPGCRSLAAPSPAEDNVCDRCRKPSRRIWPGIAQIGPILFGYGLCDPCHTRGQ